MGRKERRKERKEGGEMREGSKERRGGLGEEGQEGRRRREGEGREERNLSVWLASLGKESDSSGFTSCSCSIKPN